MFLNVFASLISDDIISLSSVNVDATCLMFVISVFNVMLSLESFAFVLRAFLRDVSKHLPLSLLKISPFKFTLPVNVRISLIFEGA